jgi:hypothetical protein
VFSAKLKTNDRVNPRIYSVKSVVLDDCDTDLIVLKVLFCFIFHDKGFLIDSHYFLLMLLLVVEVSESREDQPYLELSNEYPEEGEDVFVISTPEGLEGVVSPGIVSALHNQIDLQITCPISSGSSGAPVFNYYVRAFASYLLLFSHLQYIKRCSH